MKIPKKLRRYAEDLAYAGKRFAAFPFDVAASVCGGIPPSYYLHDRHEADLDARRYEDFKEKWIAKHNATEDDFYNEFIAPCDGPNSTWSANIRHDMICRTGIDIEEELVNALMEDKELVNTIMKNLKKEVKSTKAKRGKKCHKKN